MANDYVFPYVGCDYALSPFWTGWQQYSFLRNVSGYTVNGIATLDSNDTITPNSATCPTPANAVHGNHFYTYYTQASRSTSGDGRDGSIGGTSPYDLLLQDCTLIQQSAMVGVIKWNLSMTQLMKPTESLGVRTKVPAGATGLSTSVVVVPVGRGMEYLNGTSVSIAGKGSSVMTAITPNTNGGDTLTLTSGTPLTSAAAIGDVVEQNANTYTGLDAISKQNMLDFLAVVHDSGLKIALVLLAPQDPNEPSGGANIGAHTIWTTAFDGSHATTLANVFVLLSDVITALDGNFKARECIACIDLCNEYYYQFNNLAGISYATLKTAAVGDPVLSLLAKAKAASKNFPYTISTAHTMTSSTSASPNQVLCTGVVQQAANIAYYAGVDLYDLHLYKNDPGTDANVQTMLPTAFSLPNPWFCTEAGWTTGDANAYNGDGDPVLTSALWWLSNLKDYGCLSVGLENFGAVAQRTGTSAYTLRGLGQLAQMISTANRLPQLIHRI